MFGSKNSEFHTTSDLDRELDDHVSISAVNSTMYPMFSLSVQRILILLIIKKNSILVHDFPSTEIRIQHLKLAM